MDDEVGDIWREFAKGEDNGSVNPICKLETVLVIGQLLRRGSVPLGVFPLSSRMTPWGRGLMSMNLAQSIAQLSAGAMKPRRLLGRGGSILDRRWGEACRLNRSDDSLGEPSNGQIDRQLQRIRVACTPCRGHDRTSTLAGSPLLKS